MAFGARALAAAEVVAPAQLLSSIDGPLSKVLLTYPAYADERMSYADVYAELLGQLPAATQFVIVVHDSIRGELEQIVQKAGAAGRATLVGAPDYLNLLVWARDPFLVNQPLGPGRVPSLVEPIEFPRAADALLADLLDDNLELDISQSPLPLEGGNVLVGDDFVIAGADMLLRTLETNERLAHLLIPAADHPVDFAARLFRTTLAPQKEVLYAGTAVGVGRYTATPTLVDGRWILEERYLGVGQVQPIFHIDMFITLAGRSAGGTPRVLVGSPTVADQLLGRPTVPHALTHAFDRIASHLRGEGFEVLRNPLPITYVDYWADGVRSWYFASSNNCLVQDDAAAGRHVWLPTYGHGDWAELRITDDANAAVWSGLGYEVHLLGDYHRFAQNLGSVHCLVSELDRAAAT